MKEYDYLLLFLFSVLGVFTVQLSVSRSSCTEVIYKKTVFKILKTTVPESLLKREFSCEFCKIFKNTFFIEHLW